MPLASGAGVEGCCRERLELKQREEVRGHIAGFRLWEMVPKAPLMI